MFSSSVFRWTCFIKKHGACFCENTWDTVKRTLSKLRLKMFLLQVRFTFSQKHSPKTCFEKWKTGVITTLLCSINDRLTWLKTLPLPTATDPSKSSFGTSILVMKNSWSRCDPFSREQSSRRSWARRGRQHTTSSCHWYYWVRSVSNRGGTTQ
jgi:hypothetical protein